MQQDLADGTLARIHVAELNIPRRTLMIYREHGHLAEPARELIKIVRGFNWNAAMARDGSGERRLA